MLVGKIAVVVTNASTGKCVIDAMLSGLGGGEMVGGLWQVGCKRTLP